MLAVACWFIWRAVGAAVFFFFLDVGAVRSLGDDPKRRYHYAGVREYRIDAFTRDVLVQPIRAA